MDTRKTIFALVLALAASSANALDLIDFAPNTVGPEFEHLSHATQHFGSDPSNYGSEIMSIVARWDLPKGFYVELAEGLDLDKHWGESYHHGCGELEGPREEFQGRIGYKFRIH